MAITTKVYTRVEHNGLHVECNDTNGQNAVWRTCTNEKTAEHVPPSFTTGMRREDILAMRDLCNEILQQVYGSYE